MFDRIFRRTPAQSLIPDEHPVVQRQTVQSRPAAQLGISRSDTLVEQMLDDHHELRALFLGIKNSAEVSRWQDVERQLSEFRIKLTDHLLLEGVKLYAFLKQQYGHDDETFALIQDFSGEMNIIRKHVTNALTYYVGVQSDPRKQESFPSAWIDIGRALSARIAREEKSLYPLY